MMGTGYRFDIYCGKTHNETVDTIRTALGSRVVTNSFNYRRHHYTKTILKHIH